jgi:hypothetical protein
MLAVLTLWHSFLSLLGSFSCAVLVGVAIGFHWEGHKIILGFCIR